MDVVPKGKAVSPTSLKLTFPAWSTEMTGDVPVEDYTVQTRQAFDVTAWINSTVTDIQIEDVAVTITATALDVQFIHTI